MGPFSLSPSWTKVQIFRCDSCTEEFCFVLFRFVLIFDFIFFVLCMQKTHQPLGLHSSDGRTLGPCRLSLKSWSSLCPIRSFYLTWSRTTSSQVLHIQKYVPVVSMSFIWHFTDNWHDITLSFLFAVPRGTHHPSTHPSMHPPTQHCVCRVKGLGFLFGTLALSSMMDLANLNYLLHGQVAHDFCGFAANSFCFWEYTCSIQSTSWWILGTGRE